MRYAERQFAVSRYGRQVVKKGAFTMSKIVRKTSKEIESMRSRGEIMTDSERVSHLSEESVERMATDDPENFLKTDEDWAEAIILRPGIRGPQKAPTKKSIAIRLSQDVVENFKSTGTGWQSRIDDALKMFLKEHPLKHG
jgi:uncharacterized protein (DUF4415 family)